MDVEYAAECDGVYSEMAAARVAKRLASGAALRILEQFIEAIAGGSSLVDRDRDRSVALLTVQPADCDGRSDQDGLSGLWWRDGLSGLHSATGRRLLATPFHRAGTTMIASSIPFAIARFINRTTTVSAERPRRDANHRLTRDITIAFASGKWPLHRSRAASSPHFRKFRRTSQSGSHPAKTAAPEQMP